MIKSTVHPRIDDMGPTGHVHNTVLPVWFQEARQSLLEHFISDPTHAEFPLMIKEYTVTCHRELVLVPAVQVEITVERIGNSSFVLHELAHQNGQLAAESRVVYIYVGSDHRPAHIPDQLKGYLEKHMRA
jgi:acyl-CoA thioester hydrolase